MSALDHPQNPVASESPDVEPLSTEIPSATARRQRRAVLMKRVAQAVNQVGLTNSPPRFAFMCEVLFGRKALARLAPVQPPSQTRYTDDILSLS